MSGARLAALEGMKATSFLKQQHQKVMKTFDAIESGKGDLLALVESLADDLVAHMAIEQRIFYPAARAADEDLVLESYEEHAAAETALKRLLVTDVSDPTFKAKACLLRELLEHHIEEEENELFPTVERALGGDRIEALGAELEAAFAEALEEGFEAGLSPRIPIATTADEMNVVRPRDSMSA